MSVSGRLCVIHPCAGSQPASIGVDVAANAIVPLKVAHEALGFLDTCGSEPVFDPQKGTIVDDLVLARHHIGRALCALEGIAPSNDHARAQAVSESQKILTNRENEVLTWITRGKSYASIAQILGISRHTVDTHVRRIFHKLDASDRTTAAVRAIEIGLVPSMLPPA